MPFVEIWVPASTAPASRHSIADAVQAALQSTFEVPAGERLQLVTEYSPDSILCDRRRFGIERSQQPILIRITAKEGRTDEQKTKLYKQIAQQIQEGTGLRIEDLVVVLAENSSGDWSFASGLATFIQKA